MILSTIRTLLVVHAWRRRSKVTHQGLQVDKFDGIRELRLAKHPHQAVDLNLVKLLHANLVTSRDKVICSHHFNVLFALELGQVVDDILAAKRLPHCQVVHEEALCNHIEDGFGDVKHLLFANLNLHRLLSVLLFSLVVVVLLVLIIVVLVVLILIVLLRLHLLRLLLLLLAGFQTSWFGWWLLLLLLLVLLIE